MRTPMSLDEQVTRFIESAPSHQQATLYRLREMLRSVLPDTTEEMSGNGFPVYTKEGEWVAGFGSRKNGAMLYVMNADLLDRFNARLGRNRTGRSCIDFRNTKDNLIEDLWSIADDILVVLSSEL